MTVTSRPLSELIAAEAPMPMRRSAAIALALTRELQHAHRRGDPLEDPLARDVTVYSDGSIRIDRGTGRPLAGEALDDGTGAAVGRIFFELMVGRAPLDRTDAFEPALTAALPPDTCALLARSFSRSEGQWPTVGDWSEALETLAGGQATPPTSAETARVRRRAVTVAAGLTVLALATILVLVWAPRWWDGANESEGVAPPATQPWRASS